MSFGLSAAAWVAIGTAVVGAGTAVANADSQRKAMHTQADAQKAALAADAKDKVDAETQAALSANTAVADKKRAIQANTLATGAPAQQTLGIGTGNVLASAAPSPSAGRAVPALPKVSTGAF